MFAKWIAWIKGLFITPVPAMVSPPPEDFFTFAMAYSMPNEGGYSNRKDDRGGPTNMGITLATLSQWRGKVATDQDVKDLKIDEAKQIYHAWYWTDVGFDLIRNRAIATCLFDQGVLIGQKTAVMYAQLAANNSGGQPLVVDGVVGPLTIAALSKVDLKKFLAAYHTLLKSHFDAIVARDKTNTQIDNYNGWINRANRLLTLA